MLKLLVSRSADKGCKDKQGYTPLHAAAASGHIDIVKYLLRLGAEVSVEVKLYLFYQVSLIEIKHLFCKRNLANIAVHKVSNIYNTKYYIKKKYLTLFNRHIGFGRSGSTRGQNIDCRPIHFPPITLPWL